MPSFTDTTPPTWHPNCIATPAGWADPNTGEVVATIVDLTTKGASGIVAVYLNPTEATTYKLTNKTSYVTTNVLTVAVQYAQPVVVTGNPTITVTIGGTGRTATYASGNTLSPRLLEAGGTTTGSSLLYFNYTVVGGDVADGSTTHVVLTSPVALSGGTIVDSVTSVSSTLTFNATAVNAALAGVKVNHA